MDNCKILIDRLKGGASEKIGETLESAFLGEEKELKFGKEVVVSGEAYLTDDHLIVRMSAKATFSMPCAICNEMIEKPLQIQNFTHTTPLEEIPSAVFDYREALREALLIELPRTVECNGNCSARESLKPFLHSSKETYLPFSDLDKS